LSHGLCHKASMCRISCQLIAAIHMWAAEW
jgi:hypothetical protein